MASTPNRHPFCNGAYRIATKFVFPDVSYSNGRRSDRPSQQGFSFSLNHRIVSQKAQVALLSLSALLVFSILGLAAWSFITNQNTQFTPKRLSELPVEVRG